MSGIFAKISKVLKIKEITDVYFIRIIIKNMNN